jgi:hypothetical protein
VDHESLGQGRVGSANPLQGLDSDRTNLAAPAWLGVDAAQPEARTHFRTAVSVNDRAMHSPSSVDNMLSLWQYVVNQHEGAHTMSNDTIHVGIYDTWADWEPGYALAHLGSGDWQPD